MIWAGLYSQQSFLALPLRLPLTLPLGITVLIYLSAADMSLDLPGQMSRCLSAACPDVESIARVFASAIMLHNVADVLGQKISSACFSVDSPSDSRISSEHEYGPHLACIKRYSHDTLRSPGNSIAANNSTE